ncbi:thermostable carboxypeptidase 1 [Halolamina pelagica]|uniref:Thermostable carboxypeptidase 1 n=2 Tax=Halolamina pelagica TaxID=699431 RepID=A0A0P7HX21_9EURY|nr:amidohydrolase [Halolamina pelagica]KPN31638.1 thermostable carboxypeptidase 1 [Halolamina pelagica]
MKQRLFADVDDLAERMDELAVEQWEHPELGLHEERASRLLRDTLSEAGFEIEAGVGDMPTAFVASYEAGDGPTIGILGEYDALPGLSQAVSAEREPIEAGGPGHGCGHNLFGTAGVGAAIAVARALERGDAAGEVRFYGCPAEETLVGKTFMARDGVFDDLDAALTWHPSDHTAPQRGSSLALDSLSFTFEGESAHAAAAPESGRSALDAVQLLNTGVEYMREHVPEEVRVHYNVQEGGNAPNVVPAEASVWYFVRAPTREGVDRVTAWLREIADGAATMTRTDVTERYYTGCHRLVSNGVIADTLRENMAELGPVEFDSDERELAGQLQETFPEGALEDSLSEFEPPHDDAAADAALYGDPMDAFDDGETGSGSTDVGEVSQIAPTAQFRATTWALGTPGHSWQAVVANGDFGRTAVPYAAKLLAGATLDLLTDEQRLAAARAEFEADVDGYENPLPADAEPPFELTQ